MENATTITAGLPLPQSNPLTTLLLVLPPLRELLPYLLPLIPIHLVLVRLFRYHNVRRIHTKYPFSSTPNASQKPLAEMPLAAAHDILRKISGTEFGYMFNLGMQFALIRTYAIPTISHLLVATAQLPSRSLNTVGKRYADTAVLVSEIYHNLPGTARSSAAFARLNYLHGHYLKQRKISNDDMLYTLSLFMNSPPEWIAKHEWRALTELELAAVGLFHRFFGEAMEISYDVLDEVRPDPLPGQSQGEAERRSWRDDGLAFYQSLDRWSKSYEERCMLPHRDNYETAVKTLELLNSMYPRFVHGTLSRAFVSLMDERMRVACMFEKAPEAYTRLFEGVFEVRKWVVKHLMLPRRAIWGWWVPEDDRSFSSPYTDKDGRRWFTEYDALPHYVKPTVWNRWGPGGLASLALGVPRPGDKEMFGEGWKINEVGPVRFVQKGEKEFDATYGKLEGRIETDHGISQGPGEARGCPFFVKV